MVITRRSHRLRVFSAWRSWPCAALLFILAPAGCTCGVSDSDAGTADASDAGTGNGSDAGTGNGLDGGTGAGSDSGTMDASSTLIMTNTIMAVTSSVLNIQQLHVIAAPVDLPGMPGTCAYTGGTYEGLVPPVIIGPLDLSMPTTLHIHWTGMDDLATDLGGFAVPGIGEINCMVDLVIEGLGAGGVVLASVSSTNNAFAIYGVNDGPRTPMTLE